MMSVADNYKRVLDSVAETALKSGRRSEDITVLAVSKTQSVNKMLELAYAGVFLFGESRVIEALPKIAIVKESFSNVDFQFIGTYQTNKAVKIAEYFSLIHSIDRLNAADAADTAAFRIGKKSDVLAQINLAGEKQKSGVSFEDLEELLEHIKAKSSLNLRGLMMMPPFEEDGEKNRKYFKKSREIFDKYKKIFSGFDILSMGMSGDYRIAVEEGATLLRIGSIIFGPR